MQLQVTFLVKFINLALVYCHIPFNSLGPKVPRGSTYVTKTQRKRNAKKEKNSLKNKKAVGFELGTSSV